MNKICNFCLAFSTALIKIFGINIKDVLRTVFPKKNTDSFKNALVCVECLNSLRSAYNFTKSAKDNNRKTYTSTIQKLCQTCLAPVENPTIYLYDHFDNEVPYYEIKEMLDYSSLDLDIEDQPFPIICHTCWGELNKSYHFLKKCDENERRMAQIDKENSIIDSKIFQISEDVSPNVSKQTEKRICEIKMEVEEHSIKQESLDGAIVDDNFFDILIKYDKSLGTTLMGNVYIKEERADGAIRKELYIKLERMDLLKLESRTHKNRYSKKLAFRQCHLCPFTTRRTYTYLRHLTTHMNLNECVEHNTLFQCHNCAYRAKRRYSLIRHLRTMHKPIYVSKKCNYTTDMAESFRSHNEAEHNNGLISYTCEKCSYVAYSKTKLRQHVTMHDSHNIVLKCSQCDFETKEMECLDKHRMCHRNKVGKLYKCEVCSYQVKKKSNIDRHVLTHLSRKQLSSVLHSCQECRYKTKRKDSLAIHIRKQHRVGHEK